MTRAEDRVLTVISEVMRHPVRHFVHSWNWKASAVSALSRAAIFFTMNAPAGLDAALRAMATELVFRAIASGVLGSLTQALRYSRPRIVALVLLPAVGHALEYMVHHAAGTPRLRDSIAGSLAFSALSTAFTLFAMRRGVLIVGPGQQSLGADIKRMPRLLITFVVSGLRALRRQRSEATRSSPPCLRRHCI